MFYNRGEVISDQFDHLKVIGFRVSVVLFWEKTGLFGKFFLEGGEESPIPKCICQNTVNTHTAFRRPLCCERLF